MGRQGVYYFNSTGIADWHFPPWFHWSLGDFFNWLLRIQNQSEEIFEIIVYGKKKGIFYLCLGGLASQTQEERWLT